MLSEEGEARLISRFRDVLSEIGTTDDIALARSFLSVHGRYRAAMERADLLAARFGDDVPASPLMSFEEVRHFFHARRNYIDVLDRAAERIFTECGGPIGDLCGAPLRRFELKHSIKLIIDRDVHPADSAITTQRPRQSRSPVIQDRVSKGFI